MLCKNTNIYQVWRYLPAILELRRWKMKNQEFEVGLGYILSSRTTGLRKTPSKPKRQARDRTCLVEYLPAMHSYPRSPLPAPHKPTRYM